MRKTVADWNKYAGFLQEAYYTARALAKPPPGAEGAQEKRERGALPAGGKTRNIVHAADDACHRAVCKALRIWQAEAGQNTVWERRINSYASWGKIRDYLLDNEEHGRENDADVKACKDRRHDPLQWFRDHDDDWAEPADGVDPADAGWVDGYTMRESRCLKFVCETAYAVAGAGNDAMLEFDAKLASDGKTVVTDAHGKVVRSDFFNKKEVQRSKTIKNRKGELVEWSGDWASALLYVSQSDNPDYCRADMAFETVDTDGERPQLLLKADNAALVQAQASLKNDLDLAQLVELNKELAAQPYRVSAIAPPLPPAEQYFTPVCAGCGVGAGEHTAVEESKQWTRAKQGTNGQWVAGLGVAADKLRDEGASLDWPLPADLLLSREAGGAPLPAKFLRPGVAVTMLGATTNELKKFNGLGGVIVDVPDGEKGVLAARDALRAGGLRRVQFPCAARTEAVPRTCTAPEQKLSTEGDFAEVPVALLFSGGELARGALRAGAAADIVNPHLRLGARVRVDAAGAEHHWKTGTIVDVEARRGKASEAAAKRAELLKENKWLVKFDGAERDEHGEPVKPTVVHVSALHLTPKDDSIVSHFKLAGKSGIVVSAEEVNRRLEREGKQVGEFWSEEKLAAQNRRLVRVEGDNEIEALHVMQLRPKEQHRKKFMLDSRVYKCAKARLDEAAPVMEVAKSHCPEHACMRPQISDADFEGLKAAKLAGRPADPSLLGKAPGGDALRGQRAFTAGVAEGDVAVWGAAHAEDDTKIAARFPAVNDRIEQHGRNGSFHEMRERLREAKFSRVDRGRTGVRLVGLDLRELAQLRSEPLKNAHGPTPPAERYNKFLLQTELPAEKRLVPADPGGHPSLLHHSVGKGDPELKFGSRFNELLSGFLNGADSL